MNNESDRKRLRALFFDFAIKRQQTAKSAGQRFAYYTSAATALKVLDNREIWMRSASVMNDASEIHYGMHCLDVGFVESLYYGYPLLVSIQFFDPVCGELRVTQPRATDTSRGSETATDTR